MKLPPIVIALGCSALALLAVVVWAQRPARGPAAVPLAAAPQKAPEAAPVPMPAAPVPAPAPEPFTWRQVESEDYKQYIANLRAVRCPEQTIRDIIIADVNRLYADRENPLKNKPKPAGENAVEETPEQKLERLRQLRTVQQEKRWVIKELLNIDVPLDVLPSSGSRDYDAFDVALRALPEGKRDAVQVLQETYWQQSDALKAKYEKKRTTEFVAEHRQLEDSLRQDLAKVLTPQELEDYDIRTSSTAKSLSSKLATYFRPTEDEFRQIFRAQRQYEQAVERLSDPQIPGAVPENAPENPVDKQALAQQRAAERKAVEEARSAAQAQLNEQLKSSLGEERYTEYQRSQDRTYDLLARLGLRYGLPQEKVLEAYELQKSFKPQPVPGANSAANRAELQRQLNEQLTAILGEQAVRGYRRVQGGNIPLN